MKQKTLFKHSIWCSILLSSLVLLSCEIDEKKDLLFNLKDSLRASGSWQTGLNKFDFEINGKFSARIGGRTGSGTYRYYETINESIFNSGKQVATFVLTWDQRPSGFPITTKLKVFKRANGDLHFTYNGKQFTQIS